MAKATIISIVPFPISEFKPGIYPGFFEIPASNNENPEILVVGDSTFHVEIDENRTITAKCPAEDVAKSIVDDYIISNLEYSIKDNAAPGLFWEQGEHDITSVITKFSKKVEEAKIRQFNWFNKLVRLADDDWEKSRQHKFISDMQRHAAKSLKLERPWIITSKDKQIKCPACQTVINISAIVCPSCRCIINMTEYKKLQFAEVK